MFCVYCELHVLALSLSLLILVYVLSYCVYVIVISSASLSIVMNKFLVLLAVVVFAVLAVMIIGKQYSPPDVSYPSTYAEVVYVSPGFDASSIPLGSTIVVLPPRPS